VASVASRYRDRISAWSLWNEPNQGPITPSQYLHLLEPGRGIEDVADHLGHKNIQSTRIYAQIINPLREQVFELERHPKIVRLSSVITES
jgi:site-specific recombinase XerC